MIRRTMMLTSLLASNLYAAELVVNGSFEVRDATGAGAEGWTAVYGGYTTSSGPACAGRKSIRIDGGTTELGIGGAMQVVRGFKPGAVLKIRSHIYIDEFTSGIIKPIHIGFRSGDEMRYPHVNLVHAMEPTAYRLRRWLPYELVLDLSDYPDVEAFSLYTLTWSLDKTPFRGVVYVDGISVTDRTDEVAMKKRLEGQLAGLDRPVLYAPFTSTSPVLDGTLDDPAWRRSFRYAGFRTTSGATPKEQTEFMLCHDGEVLYVGVKAYASALNPVNNLLHAFRDEVTERKGPVHGDDSIEFFFAHDRMEGYYHIIANTHTTWERHRTSTGDDTTWTPEVRIGGSKHISRENRDEDAYYIVEAAFSLASLGIDPQTARHPVRFNIARADKANSEDSLWPRLGSLHEHRNYPWLMLGDAELGGSVRDTLEADPDGLVLAYSLEPAQAALPDWQVFADIRLDADRRSVYSVRAEAGANEWQVPTQERNFEYSVGLFDGRRVVYRSRQETVGRGTGSGRVGLQVVSDRPVEVSIDGIPVDPVGGVEDLYSVPLVDGVNKLSAVIHGPASLKLSWEEEPGNWLVEGADARVSGDDLRFDAYPVTVSRTILHNHSRMFPYVDDADPLQAPLGTPQPFSMIVNGLEGRTISGYRLYIEVPEPLEFVGASGTGLSARGRISCEWEAVGTVQRDGNPFTLYRITYDGNDKTVPGVMHHVPRAKLDMLRDTIMVVLRPRPESAQAGQIYSCGFYVTAEDGTITEARRTFPVKVLPALDGRGPRKLISMTWFSYRSIDDVELKRIVYASHAAAGFNVAQAGRNDAPLLDNTGMKFEMMWNMTGDTMLARETYRRFPEIEHINADGSRNPLRVPFSYISCHPGVRAAFQADVEQYIREFRPDVLHWDYEFSPFSFYASYDAYTLNDFKMRYAITEELTAAIIAERYRDQWIRYMNQLTADVFAAVHEVTQRMGIRWSLYSGYPLEYTRTEYGVDYELVMPHVDYALMGYGRPAEGMAEALRLSAENGNKPVVFGLCARPYFLHQIANQLNVTPALVCRQLVDSGHGVMYWGHYASDGRLLHAFNEINRLLHDYESFFVEGKRVAPPFETGSLGFSPENIAAYEKDGKQLIIFINQYDDEMQATFVLNNGSRYARAEEFYTGRSFDPAGEISLSIPPGRIAAVRCE